MTETLTLSIKNMVCNRCIRVVRDELAQIGVEVVSIGLGEVIVQGIPDKTMRGRIEDALARNGFELIGDARAKTIESIKHAVITLVYDDLELHRPSRISEYLAGKVGQNYRSLSSLFSSVEGITIEQYFILQKIERVKELLKYGELTISEISYRVGYSSVQHLSNQFRKVTGLSPREFRGMMQTTRKPLDEIGSPSGQSQLRNKS